MYFFANKKKEKKAIYFFKAILFPSSLFQRKLEGHQWCQDAL